MDFGIAWASFLDTHSSYAIISIACAPSRAGHGRIVSGGRDNCINVYREETAGGFANLDAPKFTIEANAVEAHEGEVNSVILQCHTIIGYTISYDTRYHRIPPYCTT